MLDLSENHLSEVKKILALHIPEYQVQAFGSRVTGKAKSTSDLDLAIMTDTPISLLKIARLREAFSESNLPFKVDIVDWSDISSNFQAIIRTSSEKI